jgi:disulfide oxidoreductase YuzD
MKRFYGDKVRIEYFDMAAPEQLASQKELLAKVPHDHLYYPLVFVNGELQIAGSAEYYEVLHVVRRAMGEQ